MAFQLIKNYIAKKDATLGYMYIYAPTHPMAGKSGKVYEHRYVMAKFLNRNLYDDEIVHHIDEDRTNNKLENLKLTTQTEHASLHMAERFPRTKFECNACKTEIYRYSKNTVHYCSVECANIGQTVFDIDKEELEMLIWHMPTTEVAKIFDVSDKAIEKRCKKYGIEKPPRGYWAKEKHKNNPNKRLPSDGTSKFRKKLTKEDVEYIRTHYVPGDKQYGARALGLKLGICHQHIAKVAQGDYWSHTN